MGAGGSSSGSRRPQTPIRATWRLWFQALGLPANEQLERGPAFEDDLLLVRAAVAGRSIALVRDIHAMDELADGRLQVVVQSPWPQAFAYYAVTGEDVPAQRLLGTNAFLRWLRSELRVTEDGGPDARTL